MHDVSFGVHSLVFSDRWTAESAPAICDAAAEIGFAHVEVLMFDPVALDRGVTRAAVANAGLGLRLGMALAADADIASEDPDIARRGEETVARALEVAAELGAPGVSGITYAAFCNYSRPPTASQRRRVAEALSRLDQRAGALGIGLGLEPVNRYESYLVNTLDEAAALIAAAGGRNLFVHADSFHMGLEEADIPSAVARHGALIRHVHVAESHRGWLGSGNFDLAGFFRALAAAGYAGSLTFEGFSAPLLGPDLVGAVRLWRPAWQDPRAAARAALAVMRAQWDSARAAVGAPRPAGEPGTGMDGTGGDGKG